MRYIEVHKAYKAKVKYHRTDDLREGTPKNGDIINVMCVWVAEDNERFAGQHIFLPFGGLWIPECDLEILHQISLDEYSEIKNKM